MLEPQAAALAALRIPASTLLELEDLLSRAEDLLRSPTPDATALAAADQAFHRLVDQASGNPVLAALIRGVSGATPRARIWRSIIQQGVAHQALAEHRAIVTALRTGDPDRARARAETHVLESEDRYRVGFAAPGRRLGPLPRHGPAPGSLLYSPGHGPAGEPPAPLP